jgi:hypothetical protein
MRNRNRRSIVNPVHWFQALLLVLVITGSIPLLSPHTTRAAEPAGIAAPSAGDAEHDSLKEINKKLTNPVSSIWSLSFQQNNYYLDVPGRWQSNLQFQPVLPIALTKDWNLITRPVFQLFNSTPYPTIDVNPNTGQAQVEIHRTTGFGDTILMEMLSPSPELVGNWLLGIGPTFIFPTGSTDWTGQGKWQVGPAAVVGYLSKHWILGAFVQNWTSFAGEGDRPDTNQMNLQPIAAVFFGEGWSIGYSGNILANWEAPSRDVWTVPVGLAINKVVRLGKLPVKIGLAGQYMPIHPDAFGQEWNIQFSLTPVIPKLISGTLF